MQNPDTSVLVNCMFNLTVITDKISDKLTSQTSETSENDSFPFTIFNQNTLKETKLFYNFLEVNLISKQQNFIQNVLFQEIQDYNQQYNIQEMELQMQILQPQKQNFASFLFARNLQKNNKIAIRNIKIKTINDLSLKQQYNIELCDIILTISKNIELVTFQSEKWSESEVKRSENKKEMKLPLLLVQNTEKYQIYLQQEDLIYKPSLYSNSLLFDNSTQIDQIPSKTFLQMINENQVYTDCNSSQLSAFQRYVMQFYSFCAQYSYNEFMQINQLSQCGIKQCKKPFIQNLLGTDIKHLQDDEEVPEQSNVVIQVFDTSQEFIAQNQTQYVFDAHSSSQSDQQGEYIELSSKVQFTNSLLIQVSFTVKNYKIVNTLFQLQENIIQQFISCDVLIDNCITDTPLIQSDGDLFIFNSQIDFQDVQGQSQSQEQNVYPNLIQVQNTILIQQSQVNFENISKMSSLMDSLYFECQQSGEVYINNIQEPIKLFTGQNYYIFNQSSFIIDNYSQVSLVNSEMQILYSNSSEFKISRNIVKQVEQNVTNVNNFYINNSQVQLQAIDQAGSRYQQALFYQFRCYNLYVKDTLFQTDYINQSIGYFSANSTVYDSLQIINLTVKCNNNVLQQKQGLTYYHTIYPNININVIGSYFEIPYSYRFEAKGQNQGIFNLYNSSFNIITDQQQVKLIFSSALNPTNITVTTDSQSSATIEYQNYQAVNKTCADMQLYLYSGSEQLNGTQHETECIIDYNQI